MRFRYFALLAGALCASAVPAFADDLFTLTGGGDTITFTLPASPTPDGTIPIGESGFYINSVAVTADGTTSLESIDFYEGSDLGGISIDAAGQGADGDGGSGLLVDASGNQLYSGSDSAPTFSLGSTDLTRVFVGAPAYSGIDNITITPAVAPTVTPEPSSILLLGSGLLGMAGVVRKRLA